MNFANVKAFAIPEGEVISVSSGGETLWRRKYKTELAYLESTGTQYIDTMVAPTNTKTFTYEVGGNAKVRDTGILGSRSTTDARMWTIFSSNLTEEVVQSGYGSQYLNDLRNCIGKDFLIKSSFSESKYIVSTTIDGETSSVMFDTASFTNTANLYLFGINNMGTLFPNFVYIGKIYHCKLYNGTVLVRDMIPVLDWNDRPCMYDKVSDELFYNQGTGEFLYG